MGDISRLAPLSGIVVAGLVIAGSLIIGFYEYLPDQGEIDTYLEENATRVQWGAYVMGLAGFFLLAFAASVWGFLRDKGAGIVWASFAAMGAIAAAALIIVNTSAMVAAGTRAGTTAGIGGGAAVTLYDLGATLMGVGMPVAMAALVAGFAAASRAASILPRWYDGLSLLLAIALLIGPVAWIAIAIAMVWLLFASGYIYRSQST